MQTVPVFVVVSVISSDLYIIIEYTTGAASRSYKHKKKHLRVCSIHYFLGLFSRAHITTYNLLV